MVGVIVGFGVEVELLLSGAMISDPCVAGARVVVGFGSLPQAKNSQIHNVRRVSSMSFRFMSVSKFH